MCWRILIQIGAFGLEIGKFLVAFIAQEQGLATVADTARYLDVVSGPHDRDRMSLPAPRVHYEALIETLEVEQKWLPTEKAA